MLTLHSPLSQLYGVGPTMTRQLQNLGLNTVYDLLWHIPLRYEDFSKIIPIAHLNAGGSATIQGKVQMITSRRARTRRLTITEAMISDNSGSIKAIWFNQPYLSKTIPVGTTILAAGQIGMSNYGLQLEHPTIETIVHGGVHTSRIVPFYSLTSTLTHRQLRTLITRVLPLTNQISEWLPSDILKLTSLPNIKNVLSSIHFPNNYAELAQSRKRLIFDEIFTLHLRAKLARLKLNTTTAPYIPFTNSTKTFVSKLPWQLTTDQKIATWEIIKNLSNPQPMYRLLQGDVGSGKTVVAGIAALNSTKAGYQTVIMAPTQILAEQHFNTLTKLFKNWPIRLGLLTQGKRQLSNYNQSVSVTKIKEIIKNGKVDIIIGTQAVLQTSITFKNIGLVIVDEQHRFGVEQRGILTANSTTMPHFLSLTATPIPRSLALTIFGELDISVLKKLPAGRQTINTKIISSTKRADAYKLMAQEVSKGNRVFIVCPLIDESDTLGIRAATTEYEYLQKNIFSHIKLGLLHGRLKNAEKSAVMEKFKNGTTPILVTTSVIEVGVDVPEATVMAIEGAERFGLAQLHQFRGRVGRSELASYCLLFTDNQNPLAIKRLQALVKYSNGFDLAEFDLTQRGPGDLLGEIQSGWGKFRFTNLVDTNLIKLVRQSVKLLIDKDPTLNTWPELLDKINLQVIHPE